MSNLKETHYADGTSIARGHGVVVSPNRDDRGGYLVRTQTTSRQSRRYYWFSDYKLARARALHFHQTRAV